MHSYRRFFLMLAASAVAMLALMYFNVYELAHIRWSETRLYMALMMIAAMAAIMLAFMQGMYKDARKNAFIFIASGVIFVIALVLMRSQATVDDTDYMQAMIPHHSIAVLTSERAGIHDVRVRALAGRILEAQRREIREMDWLIDDIAANGMAETEVEAASRPLPVFSGAPEVGQN